MYTSIWPPLHMDQQLCGCRQPALFPSVPYLLDRHVSEWCPDVSSITGSCCEKFPSNGNILCGCSHRQAQSCNHNSADTGFWCLFLFIVFFLYIKFVCKSCVSNHLIILLCCWMFSQFTLNIYANQKLVS